MRAEYRQVDWDAEIEQDCRDLIRLAIREDLDRGFDWTTACLVPSAAQGSASIVARKPGVIAGLPVVRLVLAEMDRQLTLETCMDDGAAVIAGAQVARLTGPARSLLTAERPLLNFLGRLSGIATLTRSYVERVQGTQARIYDTRKTLPGWRRLDKYAVRCGGGWNHRLGLYDGILIKDNHLAFGKEAQGSGRFTPREAVEKAQELVRQVCFDAGSAGGERGQRMLIEVEVESLAQLEDVLPAGPDIVLLDNMSCAQMREAVLRRDAMAPAVELEASGGVELTRVAEIAQTGVERISVGALTHSAAWFDVGLDWNIPV